MEASKPKSYSRTEMFLNKLDATDIFKHHPHRTNNIQHCHWNRKCSKFNIFQIFAFIVFAKGKSVWLSTGSHLFFLFKIVNFACGGSCCSHFGYISVFRIPYVCVCFKFIEQQSKCGTWNEKPDWRTTLKFPVNFG